MLLLLATCGAAGGSMRVSALSVLGLEGVCVPLLPPASFLLFTELSTDLAAFGDKLNSLKCVFLPATTGVCNFGGGSAPGISIGDGNAPGSSKPLCD